ncbi:hypothetical protein DXF96_01205 [Heyndrickxia coagulans]|uniref:Uncharacterized protein n=1 Tax=Heyndrickxia coagulans TaxID=1398 RepID=A0A133L2V8_HEYCO|nr:hypothetical protein CIW84_04605 [Heyndrickxia coagulans]AVD57023.1 hypothetical protein C3766_13360 [Heyndrickxia coagulans]AWP37962.1 hypothetical protein CYJ15_13705 [Heyndrickxia coagulans]KWZ86097.1 hypothetical protein HMPREF3213_00158 [Heyndrickxia coagulans]KXT19523.1 hypothetical protein UZ35_14755 [Heyndrickxia coagulans]
MPVAETAGFRKPKFEKAAQYPRIIRVSESHSDPPLKKPVPVAETAGFRKPKFEKAAQYPRIIRVSESPVPVSWNEKSRCHVSAPVFSAMKGFG